MRHSQNHNRIKRAGIRTTGTPARLVAAGSLHHPEWQVRFHTGYQVDADDWADVSALCERFGISVPDDYRRFEQG